MTVKAFLVRSGVWPLRRLKISNEGTEYGFPLDACPVTCVGISLKESIVKQTNKQIKSGKVFITFYTHAPMSSDANLSCIVHS